MYFGQIPPAVVRERLGVEPDYAVDGVLGFGIFDRAADPVVAELTDHARRAGHEVTLRPIRSPMFAHAVEVVLTAEPRPRRLWLVPVMGTAVMAYYLHMACLLGARALVLGGSAGGLAEGMAVGDLVVPTVVTGNDSAALYARHSAAGTVRGPHGPRLEPDPALATNLADRLRALHPPAPLWRSETVTCEMFGAETGEDVTAWAAAGFGAVEMEAAVTCAVGAAFGVPAAAALYVADCLVGGETVYHATYGDSRAVRHASRRAVVAASFDTLLAAIG